MALAGIDTLLIQASFSQQPAESRCLGPGQEARGGLSRQLPPEQCDGVRPGSPLYLYEPPCGRFVPHFPHL